ncbi:MAG: ATPase, T2SS/T4P/T4SS family [Chloroflexota bacterium]
MKATGMKHEELVQALGPLGGLYAQPEVQRILVDAPRQVLVERGGRLEPSGVRFDSPEALEAVIEAALALAGVARSLGETIYEARLVDGARLLAVLPPTAPNGPYLVIGKLVVPTLTWEQLLEFGSVTPGELELLQSAIRARRNFLIAGGTASGKTTVANLLAESIPEQERLVIVEGVHEMQIRSPRAIFLEADEASGPSLSALLSAAARMRPDWLVVGELLGAESMRAMEIFSRGHNGMTTIHADSAEDALARLEALCLMANLGLGLNEIRTLIAAAIQVITYQERLPNGKRRLTHIVELRGLENGRYVLQPLWRYNPQNDQIEPTGLAASWA